MHITSRIRLPRLTGAAVLISLSLLAVLPAEARERHTGVTGPNGQTATRDVSRVQGDVSSITTGPNGKSASRQVDRSATGTSAMVTGPNGQSASRSTTRSATGSQTTVTGPDGGTGTVSVQHSQ